MALPTRVHRGFVDPVDVIGHEFDNVLGRFFGQQGNAGSRAMLTPYGVDIREDADHLYVEADMPGFKKEEVDITFENQTLTISAEHREETKDDGKKVDARLEDGVLKVTLNKREETKPRKIQVG